MTFEVKCGPGEDAAYALLLQPTKRIDVLGCHVDDGEPARLLRLPVADLACELKGLHRTAGSRT
jgi:hypothetical protein